MTVTLPALNCGWRLIAALAWLGNVAFTDAGRESMPKHKQQMNFSSVAVNHQQQCYIQLHWIFRPMTSNVNLTIMTAGLRLCTDPPLHTAEEPPH